MSRLHTNRNRRNEYVIVDAAGKAIRYFRLIMAARYWINKNQHLYPEGDLKIIKNDKV
jgi:hypothetical protein